MKTLVWVKTSNSRTIAICQNLSAAVVQDMSITYICMPIPSHSGIVTGSPKTHSAMLLRQNLDALQSSPSATCNSMDRGMNFKCNLHGTMLFVVDNEMFWPPSVVSIKQILYHDYTLNSYLVHATTGCTGAPVPSENCKYILMSIYVHSRNRSIATACRTFQPRRPSSTAYKNRIRTAHLSLSRFSSSTASCSTVVSQQSAGVGERDLAAASGVGS